MSDANHYTYTYKDRMFYFITCLKLRNTTKFNQDINDVFGYSRALPMQLPVHVFDACIRQQEEIQIFGGKFIIIFCLCEMMSNENLSFP